MNQAGEAPVIAVTRAGDDGEALSLALEEGGAAVLRAPLIATIPLDSAPLARALDEVPDAWVACTSRRAVQAVVRAARLAGRGQSLGIACVGAATADAARAEGCTVALQPAVSDAHHLALAIIAADGIGRRPVLFAAAAEAHDTLPDTLRRAGYEVREFACYETRHVEGGATLLSAELAAGAVRVVTFASGSAARSFADQVPRALWDLTRYVTIGRTTAADAEALGLPIAGIAPEQTVEALAHAALAVAAMDQRSLSPMSL